MISSQDVVLLSFLQGPAIPTEVALRLKESLAHNTPLLSQIFGILGQLEIKGLISRRFNHGKKEGPFEITDAGREHSQHLAILIRGLHSFRGVEPIVRVPVPESVPASSSKKKSTR